MADFLSWFSGLALMFIGSLVMWAYRPARWPTGAAGWLQAAVFFGFAAAVLNTGYWQVLGHPLIAYNVLTVDGLRVLGDWLDVIFKGGGAYSAWMHLKALHMSLDEEEQRRWGVLEVAFYPKRRLCLRLIGLVLRRKR